MIATGAMCDPYVPLEEELQITRQCLAVIERYGCGLSILTKSSRVLRDLDLLRAINENAKFVGQMTLTTYDEELCRKLEPNVSTTSERVHVLEVMRDNNIPAVVWLSPVLPFINDTEENLRGLLDYCVQTKVKGIVCFGFGVTLREGNREYFYAQLDRLFPGMKQRYIRSFGNAYVCNSPHNSRLMAIFKEICEQHDILWQTDDVFAYLRLFEQNPKQLSLF
jgi:DNA repair photolyase